MANIRTARRSGRVFRGGRMVRETLWAGVTGSFESIATASTAVLLNITGAGLLALRPWTVVRSRGVIMLETDQDAARERQAVNIGAAIVSDQAVAIGITALPTPTTDKDSDLWYLYQSVMASQGAGTVNNNLGTFVEYDSRAMRKVEDGSQLVYVLESEVVALTQGTITRHTGRLLIKLH